MGEVIDQKILGELDSWGITLTKQQVEQFEEYFRLLTEWNKKINLTRITEPDAVARLHYMDSLAPLKFCSLANLSLIDIGTGAGFPGIPLKIAVPSLRLTLLDALDKRCRFLHEVVDTQGLTDVTILHGRAEDVAASGKTDNLRASFDVATSRAVAGLSVLCEYAIPLLKTGGNFIAYKMDSSTSELDEVQQEGRCLDLLHASLERKEVYTLPDSEPVRALYFFTKNADTPAKYPRRSGLPEKKPL